MADWIAQLGAAGGAVAVVWILMAYMSRRDKAQQELLEDIVKSHRAEVREIITKGRQDVSEISQKHQQVWQTVNDSLVKGTEATKANTQMTIDLTSYLKASDVSHEAFVKDVVEGAVKEVKKSIKKK